MGPVQEAEIELRPLTVFVGQNNTGKTWTAYLISGILGPFGRGMFVESYTSGDFNYDVLEEAIKDIVEKGNAKIDLIHFIDSYGTRYINDTASLSKEWAGWFLGSKTTPFKDFSININPRFDDAQIRKAIMKSTAKNNLAQRKDGEALLNALKEANDQVIYFYTTGGGLIEDQIPIKAIKEFVVRLVSQIIHRAIYNNTYFFPTERTAFTQVISNMRPTEDEKKKASSSTGPGDGFLLSFPITNFMSTTVSILIEGNLPGRIKASETEPCIKRYLEFVDILENSILEGHLEVSSSKPNILREVRFQYSKSQTGPLEIPIVSSMVKELVALALFLRYKATPGDLLVIDEPEMHLHPEAQVALAEFLAMMANSGLRVIITTHSPYIVDHLINLMRAASRTNKDEIKNMFYLKQSDAFIEKKDVAVYLFQNGTAKTILDEEGIIDWKTFSEVSEKLSKLYFEI